MSLRILLDPHLGPLQSAFRLSRIGASYCWSLVNLHSEFPHSLDVVCTVQYQRGNIDVFGVRQFRSICQLEFLRFQSKFSTFLALRLRTVSGICDKVRF